MINGQVFYQSGKSKVPGADGQKPLDSVHFPAALPHAFDLFLDVLAGAQKPEVLIPIEDALNVVQAMEAMYLGDKLAAWAKV